MNKVLTILLLGLIPAILYANEIKVSSQIDDVTVFLKGAQINRSASVTVPKGTSDIVFTGISPLLKRESLQAGTKSDLTILAVYYETKITYKNQDKDQLDLLEKQKKELDQKLKALLAKRQVLTHREIIISNLVNYQSENASASIDDILKAEQVIATKLETIKLESLNLEKEIEEVNHQLNLITQKVNALGGIYESIEPRVVIQVQSETEMKVKFGLSYFVQNARWYPSYNLQVKNLDEPLIIEYQANISQQTGEDWDNVKMTLSTTDPNLSGQKPVLTPWYLVLNQNSQQNYDNGANRYTPTPVNSVSGRVTDQYGDPLPFATVMIEGSTIGTYTDADGYYHLNVPQGSKQITVKYIGYNDVTVYLSGNLQNFVLAEKPLMLEEVVVVSDMEDRAYTEDRAYIERESYQSISLDYAPMETVSSIRSKKNTDNLSFRENRQIKYSATYSVPVEVSKIVNVVSAEFAIKEKYLIPSDEKNYTVKIDEIEKKVSYQYYCAPRMSTDVFLTAEMTDWEDLNLLEGEANIFFEGTFVGSSLLDAKFVGDTLDISLGRDKRVVVERNLEKQYSKYKVLGDEATKSVKWVISVKNNKDVPIHLIVEDQFPLSTDSRIRVETDDVEGAILNEKTGIITWDLKIGGGKMAEVAFKYKVTYPSGNDVYLN